MSAHTQERATRHRWRSLVAATAPKATDVIDDAARTLGSFARSLLDSASRVVRNITSVSHSAVTKQAYEDRTGIEDRAWQFPYRGAEIFCIVDEAQQRALLNLIVGGSPAGRLSEIERRIVAEAVCQLLRAGASDAEICEQLRGRPRLPTWSCTVELAGSTKQTATLMLFTSCSVELPPRIVRPNLNFVSIPLRAALLPHSFELGRISKWECGSIVRLHRAQFVRDVCLYAGSHQLARGQLGSLFGERAVIITELTAARP